MLELCRLISVLTRFLKKLNFRWWGGAQPGVWKGKLRPLLHSKLRSWFRGPFFDFLRSILNFILVFRWTKAYIVNKTVSYLNPIFYHSVFSKHFFSLAKGIWWGVSQERDFKHLHKSFDHGGFGRKFMVSSRYTPEMKEKSRSCVVWHFW